MLFFPSNSYELDSVSFIQLNNIARYLLKNTDLVIEIQGHTDNVGNDLDNLILSEKELNLFIIIYQKKLIKIN